MKTYKIVLNVDEKWLEAINNLTKDVYEGEVCTWLSMTEVVDEWSKCEKEDCNDCHCAEC